MGADTQPEIIRELNLLEDQLNELSNEVHNSEEALDHLEEDLSPVLGAVDDHGTPASKVDGAGGEEPHAPLATKIVEFTGAVRKLRDKVQGQTMFVQALSRRVEV